MIFKINNISIKITHTYMDPLYKIYSNKYTRLKKKKQKNVSKSIKSFRYLGILPFSTLSITTFKKSN